MNNFLCCFFLFFVNGTRLLKAADDLIHTICFRGRKMWEFASDPGPDLMDMEEKIRSHHDPQNRYRDRHRQRDERYGRRDDDHYRRNPGYNFGLEGKAKYGSRSAFVLRVLC